MTFLLFAIITFSVQFIFTKKYQADSSGGVYAGAYFSMVYGFVLSMAFLAICSFDVKFTTAAVVWAFVFSSCAVVCQICVILAMEKGSVGIVTMFILSGGLLLPFGAGILFWNERIGTSKVIGCVLIVLAFIYQNIGKKDRAVPSEKNQKGFVPLCIILFLTNGILCVAAKAHQISENAVSTNNFIFINSLIIAVLSTAVVIYCRSKIKGAALQKYKFRHILSILGYSLMNGIGNFFSFTAAKTLDASLQFPILSSAIVCLTSALAFIVFKEKLKKKDIIAITINTSGIICFLFAI